MKGMHFAICRSGKHHSLYYKIPFQFSSSLDSSVQFSSFHFKFHNIQIFKELNNIKHKLHSINYNTNIKRNITTEILENL